MMLQPWRGAPARDGRRARSPRWRPVGEGLEGRVLMATAGVDYALSGYRWSNPNRITYSIAPDGVAWDHGTNSLNAAFDAKFGAGAWRREIARALATWETVANVNIAQVGDSAIDFGAVGSAQGDPRFGDIRFGGYPYQGDTTTLAQTYYPPPQGWTEPGDVAINTALNFTIGGGGGYDLYSVLLHETGHSLGLEHAVNPAEVLYGTYEGVRAGLEPGDIAGIQAIYGPRTPDVYQSHGQGRDFAGAIDVTGGLGVGRKATLTNVSLATVGDTEFFSVIAPNASGEALQVTAAAAGISLLSPKVSVFDASGTLLGSSANPSAWGDNVTVSTDQVVPGQRYYIAVTGATSDVFAVGAYALQVTFVGGAWAGGGGSDSPPASPPPVGVPVVPPTSPWTIAPDVYEPNDGPTQATALGKVAGPVTLGGLTLHTPADVDYFVFQNGRAGIYQVSAPGTTLRVIDANGRQIATGVNRVAIQVFRPRTGLFVQVSTAGGSAVASYSLTVAQQGARLASASPGRGRPHPGRGAHWPIRPRPRLH